MVPIHINLRLTFLTMILHVHSTICDQNHDEVFSAVSELEPLLATQKKIIEDLNVYISSEENRIKTLKRYYTLYKEENDKAMQDISDYIGNPINAFKLIKRLTTTLNNVEDVIKHGAKNMKNITRYHKGMKYPSRADLTGAARAIIRLQNVYQLNVRDVAQGILCGVNHSVVMSTDDCYELGRALYFDKDYNNGREWLLEAYNKYLQLKPRDRQMLPFDDRKIKELIEDIKTEIQRKQNMRELYPANERPDWEIKKEMKRIMKRYAALCRGELGVPRKVSKRFKCWYNNKHHPFLKYAPIKVEQMYMDPDIYVFHDVIYDDEIKILQDMTKLKFRRSQVFNAKSNKYVPAKSRICKSFWYKDEHSPTVAKISRRVMDMTGLSAASSEELQVINYGIAGHYNPHVDFAQAKHPAFERYVGNRIATLLFYLSDVAQGGATVFTDIGVTVPPIKGSAVFWWNLHPSGQGNLATRHAACPVISGSKWIASKWLHEGGQELVRPCTLEYQPEGFQGKRPRLVKKTIR